MTDRPLYVETQDGQEPPPPRHPIVLVLDNLRSAYNTGNIFRLAEITRIERVVACGYTPCPPHPKLAKTARGCDELVPFSHAPTSLAAVEELRRGGYRVVAVETVADAPDVWATPLAFPVAFVLGNEALGIEAEALAACDEVVRLPVFGQKNSMNVGNCAAVVLYTAVRQLLTDDEHRGP